MEQTPQSGTTETKPAPAGKLYKASLADSYSQSVIGGGGRDLERQNQLDQTLASGADHRRPEDIEAYKLLQAGKISMDEFRRRTNTHM